MKFIVTTTSDEAFRPVSDITFPVIAEYCDRHGYEFRPNIIATPERSVVWDRVRTLQDALKECDWAVHIDSDLLITNLHIPLTEFTAEGYSIVISKAPYLGVPMFNDGFMMVKSVAGESAPLNQAWQMDRPADKIFCAQDALWRMYNGYWNSYFSVQPQKRFNSMLFAEKYGLPDTQGQWTIGDFALHLPGMNAEDRVSTLQEYLPKILR